MTTMRIADSLKRFLRPVYWWYHRQWEHHLERKRRLRKWREIVFPLGQKVYLIGTPSHENLGDSAIVLAQKAFLKSCGWEEERIIELTDEDYARDWERIRKWVPKNGFIAQLGGGHHDVAVPQHAGAVDPGHRAFGVHGHLWRETSTAGGRPPVPAQ